MCHTHPFMDWHKNASPNAPHTVLKTHVLHTAQNVKGVCHTHAHTPPTHMPTHTPLTISNQMHTHPFNAFAHVLHIEQTVKGVCECMRTHLLLLCKITIKTFRITILCGAVRRHRPSKNQHHRQRINFLCHYFSPPNCNRTLGLRKSSFCRPD